MSKFDQSVKLLSQKDWGVLRTFWYRHIPEISRVGQEPQDTIERNIDFQKEAVVAPRGGDHRFHVSVNPAPTVFREAVFVLCKAVRVSCESASQAADGLPTWAISTAHHSSIFALRAFLAFCGITYVVSERGTFLVDVIPHHQRGNRKKKIRDVGSNREIQLIRTSQMGHKEWWMLYQRMLRISKGFPWSLPVSRTLSLCDPRVFSMHRNQIHYRLRWFYDDLLDGCQVNSFGNYERYEPETLVDALSTRNGSDGTLFLNQVLIGNTISLLSDLGRVSNRVANILSDIDSVICRRTNEVIDSWYSRLPPVE